jgi:hypothetical protein
MQFLYPTSRQFPFDEVCEQIVRELKKRNWEVPGMEVKFNTYGNMGQFRTVSSIRGDDFKLAFYRIQGRLSRHWNDTAAISTLVIPKKELQVNDDESGLMLYLYVGKDYEKDRKRFIDSSKFLSKHHREPKTYLMYTGGCDCEQTIGAVFNAVDFMVASLSRDANKLNRITHTHRGCRPPLLVHNNDLGREYDPEGDEPKVFHTDEVFEEFKQFLTNVVLKKILEHPVVKVKKVRAKAG